jgi:hypothetical protein
LIFEVEKGFWSSRPLPHRKSLNTANHSTGFLH